MASKNYLDNAEFELAVSGYLESKTLRFNPFEEQLVEMFQVLISNIYHGFKYDKQMVEEEDAMQNCYLLVFRILPNFDPEKATAFNYFTTVINNELKRIFTRNKRYEEKISKFKELKERELGDS